MAKLVYIGFAFEHHLGTHGGYHHIANYVNYDKIIDCQRFFSRTWHPSSNIFARALRRISNKLFGFPSFPTFIFKMIYLSLRYKCIFHIIYGENIYKPWMGKIMGSSKFVCTFHQPFNWFDNEKWLNNLKQIDRIILVGENELDLFRKATGKDNVVFIPHGVYTDFYHPIESVGKEKLLLTVGNWLRDYELADKVYTEFLNRHPDWTIRAVANRSSTGPIHNDNRIKCLTGISDVELRELYLKSSVLFLPLKRYTANNSLLEAAACGCNILIASNNADNSYIPSEYVDIITMDVDKIINKLEEKIINPQYNDSLAKFVDDHYSWTTVGNKVNEYLRTI